MIELPLDQSIARDHVQSYRTQSLFYEENTSTLDAVFTLKDKDIERDGKYYISLKRLYLEMMDPTEYEFAISIFGNWKHWTRLLENKRLFNNIKQWREELEIKMRSKAIRTIMDTAGDTSSKSAVAAARYVAEKGWDKRKAGRPTKEEVKRETRIAAGINDELSDDMKRIGLPH